MNRKAVPIGPAVCNGKEMSSHSDHVILDNQKPF